MVKQKFLLKKIIKKTGDSINIKNAFYFFVDNQFNLTNLSKLKSWTCVLYGSGIKLKHIEQF